MIKIRAKMNADDRRATIEVQLTDPIELKHEVEAVILPNVFLDVPEVRSVITGDWGAEPLTYETSLIPVSQYTSVIYERAREFLSRKGYFDGP
jgi:hypothetical protein